MLKACPAVLQLSTTIPLGPPFTGVIAMIEVLTSQPLSPYGQGTALALLEDAELLAQSRCPRLTAYLPGHHRPVIQSPCNLHSAKEPLIKFVYKGFGKGTASAVPLKPSIQAALAAEGSSIETFELVNGHLFRPSLTMNSGRTGDLVIQ